MPKKVSEIQKKEIVSSFTKGKTIDELSKEYNCTKLTITRHLKKSISEKDYKNFLNRNNPESDLKASFKENTQYQSVFKELSSKENSVEEKQFMGSEFVEITPLDYEIEGSMQKDLSSIPIANVEFPKIVYMVVNKDIELEIKLLKDYPDWQFLSKEELGRKTIRIFNDLKIAKRFCNKEQKVIKVPNTNVFKIAAHVLIAKGISRIINEDKLIAL